MPRDRSPSTILILSQVYVPDPASVGQHMDDAARMLASRGYRVKVLTSRRGFEDPSQKYQRWETRDRVEIVRLGFSSFGKKTVLRRLAGALPFLAQCFFYGLFTRRLKCVLVSTSPPMGSLAALAIAWLRRVPIKYWVMDLNPDQMIALGRISSESLPARVFDWINRRILNRADDVVVLDRFMAERVQAKVKHRLSLTILPPWPHEDHLDEVPQTRNPFVERHGLHDKFVVMYSGNHSIASPLSTLIEAALKLQDTPKLLFMFVGGGLGKREVEEAIATHRPSNIVSLPYQPLSEIKYSLSAADLHVVALGDPMVGVIHPCKIYGAMAVGRPILYLGPSPSHVTDLIEPGGLGWRIAHGDVEGAVETLRTIADMDPDDLLMRGKAGLEAVAANLAKERLCGMFCDVIERGLKPAEELPARPVVAAEPVEARVETSLYELAPVGERDDERRG